MQRRDIGEQARWALIVSVGLTAALYMIPRLEMLAYPFRMIGTAVHEMGHGVAALLVGGGWDRFTMYSDGSGQAQVYAPSGWPDAFVSAGGLVGPAVIGAIFLVLGRRPNVARWCLGAAGAFYAIACVVWVRSGFGWLIVGGLAVACLGIALRTRAQTAQLALVFLSTQLALSAYSDLDYMFSKTASGEMNGGAVQPSDAAQMAHELGGTYWMWGTVVAAFSALVLAGAFWLYMRKPRTATLPA